MSFKAKKLELAKHRRECLAKNCLLQCPPGICRLDKCDHQQFFFVKAINTDNTKLMNKLTSMGVVPGAKVEVLRAAPWGDPIEIRTLGYRLSLRLSEAACVTVENAA